MDCKKVRDILISGYIDGEVTGKARDIIKGHLALCSQCQEYELNLRKHTAEVFTPAGRVKPPEEVWHKIKDNIAREKQKVWGVRFVEMIYEFINMRRPVLALSSVAVVLLLVIVFVRFPVQRENMANIYLVEQVEYFSHLKGNNGTNGSSVDLGTDIEKYFM